MKLITTGESNDKSLVTITSDNAGVDEIVIYLRASYVVLNDAAVIKVSQDSSYLNKDVERYALYFFVQPTPTTNYTVYRAIADFDSTTEETRVLTLAFDLYVSDNQLTSTIIDTV